MSIFLRGQILESLMIVDKIIYLLWADYPLCDCTCELFVGMHYCHLLYSHNRTLNQCGVESYSSL